MSIFLSPVRMQTFYSQKTPGGKSPKKPAAPTLQEYDHLFVRRGVADIKTVFDKPLSKLIKEMTDEKTLPKIKSKEEEFYRKLYDIVSTAYEELLISGELEHAAALKGDTECIEKERKVGAEIAASLSRLNENIPFPDGELKERISMAAQNLDQSLKDPGKKILQFSTRAALLPIINSIDKHIDRLENARLFRKLDKKIKKSRQEYRRISKSTFWTGTASSRTYARGMRRTEFAGVLKPEIVSFITNIAKLLDQTGRILGSINSELKSNQSLQKEVERIYRLPDQSKEWEGIREIWNSQKKALLRIRRMTRRKLSTVLILLSIGTLRADRLAKSRLKTSLKELLKRESTLLNMMPKLEKRLEDQRERIKEILVSVSWDMAYGILSMPQILENPKILKLACKRMEEICSQALPDEAKEDFLRIAKEDLIKALDLIRRANALSEKKKNIKEAEDIKQINNEIVELLVEAVDPLVLVKFRINNIGKKWSAEQRQKQTEDYLKAHDYLRRLIRAEKAIK